MDRERAALEDAARALRVDVAARLDTIDALLSVVSNVLADLVDQQQRVNGGIAELLRRTPREGGPG